MSDKEGLTGDSTAALIKGLATQAGKPQTERPSFGFVFPAALLFSIVAAVGVVLMMAGARSDLANILSTWTFQFKVAGMILVAAGAGLVARNVVRPGAAVRALLCLAPGALFLLLGALFDRSGFPLFGIHSYSVPDCAGIIVLSSIPALAAILAAMRAGTPTRLGRAGAVAGLLAGSLGGLAYTVACLNDGATFVALWYSAAIGVVGIMGAAIGPKVLRW